VADLDNIDDQDHVLDFIEDAIVAATKPVSLGA
jgi:hypothetical protein